MSDHKASDGLGTRRRGRTRSWKPGLQGGRAEGPRPFPGESPRSPHPWDTWGRMPLKHGFYQSAFFFTEDECPTHTSSDILEGDVPSPECTLTKSDTTPHSRRVPCDQGRESRVKAFPSRRFKGREQPGCGAVLKADPLSVPEGRRQSKQAKGQDRETCHGPGLSMTQAHAI